MSITMNNLDTSLSERLRNTNLPKTYVLFPIFEAVVNILGDYNVK